MQQRHTDILSFIKESKTFKTGNNIFLVLNPLRQKEIEELKKFFNIDFSNYVRSMDDSCVRHAEKHNNITDEDLLLGNYITENYDFVCYDTENKKVVYSKKITEKNGERKFYYVEYIQTGKKRMAMKTMYKTRIL